MTPSTVGQFLELSDLIILTDYAFYMEGRHKRTFRQGCWVESEQSKQIFDDRWNTFDRWQAWQEDFARVAQTAR